MCDPKARADGSSLSSQIALVQELLAILAAALPQRALATLSRQGQVSVAAVHAIPEMYPYAKVSNWNGEHEACSVCSWLCWLRVRIPAQFTVGQLAHPVLIILRDLSSDVMAFDIMTWCCPQWPVLRRQGFAAQRMFQIVKLPTDGDDAPPRRLSGRRLAAMGLAILTGGWIGAPRPEAGCNDGCMPRCRGKMPTSPTHALCHEVRCLDANVTTGCLLPAAALVLFPRGERIRRDELAEDSVGPGEVWLACTINRCRPSATSMQDARDAVAGWQSSQKWL